MGGEKEMTAEWETQGDSRVYNSPAETTLLNQKVVRACLCLLPSRRRYWFDHLREKMPPRKRLDWRQRTKHRQHAGFARSPHLREGGAEVNRIQQIKFASRRYSHIHVQYCSQPCAITGAGLR